MKPKSPLSWGVALLIGVASLGITGPASAELIADPSLEQQLVDPVAPTPPAPADDSATADEVEGSGTSDPANEAESGADGTDDDGASGNVNSAADGSGDSGGPADAVGSADPAPSPEADAPDDDAPVVPIAITSITDEADFSTEDSPARISGSGEPDAPLVVTVRSYDWEDPDEDTWLTDRTVEDTVEADGSWSAALADDGEPLPEGAYWVSAQQLVDGENSADEVFFHVFDEWSTDFEPTIDNIEPDSWNTGPLTSLSGSGEPDATLEIFTARGTPFSEGDSTKNEYVTTVDADGSWQLQLAQPVQSELFIAYVSQLIDGEFVGMTGVFAYFFEPVTITSVSEGDRIAADEAPSVIEGTLDPALASSVELGLGLSVSLNGTGSTFVYDPDAQPDVVVNADGTWSADFGDAIAPGSYLATAGVVFSETDLEAQNEMELASTMFTVLGGASPGSGDELARTGSSSLLPWILGAIVLVLIGVGALLLSRRTRADDADDADAADAPSHPESPER